MPSTSGGDAFDARQTKVVIAPLKVGSDLGYVRRMTSGSTGSGLRHVPVHRRPWLPRHHRDRRRARPRRTPHRHHRLRDRPPGARRPRARGVRRDPHRWPRHQHDAPAQAGRAAGRGQRRAPRRGGTPARRPRRRRVPAAARPGPDQGRAAARRDRPPVRRHPGLRDRRLDRVVVVDVSSTEPPHTPGGDGGRGPTSSTRGRRARRPLGRAQLRLRRAPRRGPPTSPSPPASASIPALDELAETATPYAGKDGKTGETLMKTVLAPMFAHRNCKVLSWVGHNIFGNRDGLVLDDPANKASKVEHQGPGRHRDPRLQAADARHHRVHRSTWATGRPPGTTSTSRASSAPR